MSATAEREIVVVDDGSTDRTAEIVEKFAPRVRLIRKDEWRSKRRRLTRGFQECTGEIVAFLDGDDWWAPGKLQAVAGDALAVRMKSDRARGALPAGITEVCADGRQHMELLRDTPRFRINLRVEFTRWCASVFG